MSDWQAQNGAAVGNKIKQLEQDKADLLFTLKKLTKCYTDKKEVSTLPYYGPSTEEIKQAWTKALKIIDKMES